MARDNFRVDCPCCGHKLHIDVRHKRASAVDPAEARSRNLDDLLTETHGDEHRRRSQFDNAIDEEEHKKELLDKLFEDAKKRTKAEDD